MYTAKQVAVDLMSSSTVRERVTNSCNEVSNDNSRRSISSTTCHVPQEYGLMGSQQRQHLVSLSGLPDVCSQIVDVVSYQNSADYILQDLQSPLSLMGLLFRR